MRKPTPDSSISGSTDQPATGVSLQVAEVSVAFGGLQALTAVDLDIGRQDLVSIIGPNGAGKTTLLNAISRIVRFQGEIRIDGSSTRGFSPADIAELGVGRSFQDPMLLDRETVLENVMCGAHRVLRYSVAAQLLRPRAVRRAETTMADRARSLIDLIGLTGRIDSAVGGLPYGSRKLVDIARAMVAGPQLLLLDEPSSGLDAHERDHLAGIILELHRRESLTILAVEHHMDLVRAISTHVFAMQGGRAFMHGKPDEVLDSDRFQAALVGGSDSTADGEGVVQR